MIELRNVTLHRGERRVLDGLSLSLAEPRIGILGANGSGKSSFARLLNGLLLPTSGHVTVDGIDTRDDVKAARRRVGFLFQNPDNQIVHPTVAEDIAFGLKPRRLPKPAVAAAVSAILARVGLAGSEERLIHELSGGERQLVALAGVLVMEPAHLVLDEPTTLLDLRNRRRIAAAVADFPGQVILVTHDLDLVESFDRVIVFEAGHVVVDDRSGPAVHAYRALCR
ncbi:energy-coupling factor ABC transporter ATP-binding protein [Mangrovicella endophytica]|uniref:energy-coupling factor ABC transporter ATP-binding protein n=1 Tax=Mangrovicella endophytica TaxID=2066697 RepID=UPI000C9E1962|nr:ABC transporter ATP-binding protein [Mangrovicella endophytica]